MSCACRSVGKPGNGCVSSDTGSMPWPLRATRMPLLVVCTVTPVLASSSSAVFSSSGRAPSSRTSPPTAATAMAKVPVSMRSASTECTAPSRRSAPWMRSVEVPMPSILAPILTRHSATSPISGSRAAFSMTVSPRAKRGRQQHVVRGADRYLGEHDAAAAQGAALGLGENVAGFDLDLGAELLQAHQMQIDGTRADGAAAGQRHLGLAAAGEQRTEHPEAGPHAADHFIGRHGVDDVARREVERLADVLGGAGTLAVDGEVDAVVAQDAGEQIDVGEIGDVLQRQPVRGQQAGDHQRQGGVLGAGDRNRTVEPLAADDLDAIHAGVPLRRRCASNVRR